MNQTTNPPSDCSGDSLGTKVTEGCAGSDRLDLLRLGALLTLRDVELDLLALLQLAVAATLDSRVVNEDIGAAAVLLDEAEALFAVEPLHGACCHWCCLFWLATPPVWRPQAAKSRRARLANLRAPAQSCPP